MSSISKVFACISLAVLLLSSSNVSVKATNGVESTSESTFYVIFGVDNLNDGVIASCKTLCQFYDIEFGNEVTSTLQKTFKQEVMSAVDLKSEKMRIYNVNPTNSFQDEKKMQELIERLDKFRAQNQLFVEFALNVEKKGKSDVSLVVTSKRWTKDDIYNAAAATVCVVGVFSAIGAVGYLKKDFIIMALVSSKAGAKHIVEGIYSGGLNLKNSLFAKISNFGCKV